MGSLYNLNTKILLYIDKGSGADTFANAQVIWKKSLAKSSRGLLNGSESMSVSKFDVLFPTDNRIAFTSECSSNRS